MSASIDYAGGEGLYTGYQNDGTFESPPQAIMPQPVDAGGGPPANYSGATLDLFKFGLGALERYQTRQDMIDLRRWEATNAGLYQQGQAAAMFGGNGRIGLVGVAAAGLILYLLLTKG